MPTFNSFTDILPDPANPITDAGSAGTGTPGPGFSAINFSSVTDTQVSRTVSGRGVQRDGGSQRYEFTISYNPMFRDQFDPIDTFLLGRNPRRDPFYVVLPQYSKPKDPTFATYLNTSGAITVVGAYNPGSTAILIQAANGPIQGTLKPGDVLNFNDASDYNHQKAYKIARVETNALYQAGTTQPTTSQLRIHVSPPLQRAVTSGTPLVLTNPKFRVVSKTDVQEHNLNTDNLFSFSLPVEEIQA